MGLQRNVIFTESNQLTLLESGADFFPQLITAINAAQTEIYLETYIFSADATGNMVFDALCHAAKRGVKVCVIVDWVGTGHARCLDLALKFRATSVQFRRFNPWCIHGFARTHRKLFVADKELAFIGGININDDLFAERTKQRLPYPRWDFACLVKGPLIDDIHQLMTSQWLKLGHLSLRNRLQLLIKQSKHYHHLHQPIVAGLAPRDNLFFRRTIQKAYLTAIGNARHEVLIATPYFAPGKKFRNALINASLRGVKVTLLIGYGDFALQDAVAHSYYPKLLKQGVQIVEYRKSQLHAKIAVMDDTWATIGSSNCDGLSLFINQEANLLIKDSTFSKQISAAIKHGIADGVVIKPADFANIAWHKKAFYGLAFFIYSALIRLISVENFM